MARDTARLQGDAEPVRQIPGLKKPAPTWQDEVRERVARRRRQRDEMRAVTPALEQQPELSSQEVEAVVGALDRFEESSPSDSTQRATRSGLPIEPPVDPAPMVEPGVVLMDPPSEGRSERDDDPDALDQLVGSVTIDRQSPPYDAITDEEKVKSGGEDPGGEEEVASLDQLSFRTPIEPPPREPRHEPPHPPTHEVEALPPAGDVPSDTESPTWSFDLEPPRRDATPVERPAFALERAEAVAVDLLILGAMSGIVAYFAARVAQVPVSGLLSGVSYIVAFMVGVGLLYATCFTGATGQTPGKMLVGLRVVDTHGNPPGAARALLRSVLALLGLAFLGLGAVPIFLDPARRAAHDRLVGTRVIRP